MKSTLLLAIVSLLLIATPNAFASSAEDQVDNALAVSKSWVGQIDAGQYDDSYAVASEAMHDKVTQDRWSIVLKTIREPWGPVAERKQISHVYKPNGYEGTEGEFMVITYDTSFKKSVEATETVVLRWEDGKWRGAGYNAEASLPGNGSGAPDSTTETQTQEHVKPNSQGQ